jgi:hypothetical protein
MNHLTHEQVARILELVQETDAIVVGGQSLNIWAVHYLGHNPNLSSFAPFTSKDLDFYRNPAAAERLAEALGGTIYLPRPDDMRV